MASAEMTLQELRAEGSKLQLRLKAVVQENRDLRDICNESGIQCDERLAGRRHKRFFARLSRRAAGRPGGAAS